MWFPVVIFFYAFHWLDPWVVWVSSLWAHLQGFVSSTVSLMKPDIGKAVKDFVHCRIWSQNPDVAPDPQYNVGPEGFTDSITRRLSSLFRGSSSRSIRSGGSNSASGKSWTSRVGASFTGSGRGSGRHSSREDTTRNSSGIYSASMTHSPPTSTREEPYTDDLRQSLVTFQFEDELPSDDDEAPGDDDEAPAGDEKAVEESETEILHHPGEIGDEAKTELLPEHTTDEESKLPDTMDYIEEGGRG